MSVSLIVCFMFPSVFSSRRYSRAGVLKVVLVFFLDLAVFSMVPCVWPSGRFCGLYIVVYEIWL